MLLFDNIAVSLIEKINIASNDNGLKHTQSPSFLSVSPKGPFHFYRNKKMSIYGTWYALTSDANRKKNKTGCT